MLSLFDIAAILLVLSAVLGWLNLKLFRLPHTIGLLVMALVASLGVLLLDAAIPASNAAETLRSTVSQIDFFDALMNGMLAFLLFAGALHVDLGLLRENRYVIGFMATFGVLLSTAVIGTGFWFIANGLGIPIPLMWALVFGSLISPTDPVAVLSLLKSVRISEAMEAKIAGESLFNDGVGVVVFIVLVAIASGETEASALGIAEIFFVEAVGGAVLGLVAGILAVKLMATIDEYSTEILITLALVTGTYALAQTLHMSGPIAVVLAGLLVGNRGAEVAMTEETRSHLFDFWEVIDELLNSVLFLLIGLEVIIITLDPSLVGLALAAIPLVLLARFLAVSLPILGLSLRRVFERGSIPILTWGGVRGGISVALALSLPNVPAKPAILFTTYVVVIFSIVVQGLTIRGVVRRATSPVPA